MKMTTIRMAIDIKQYNAKQHNYCAIFITI